MKKNICFVAINARYSHSNLAIYYLDKVARANRYHSSTLVFAIKETAREIIKKIYAKKPAIIAFSVYIWNSELIREILPSIKQLMPETIIICGGPEMSYNGNSWLKNYPQIGTIISGAGENALATFLADPAAQQNKIICEPTPICDIPSAYTPEDLTPLMHNYVYYESSRGCPFACSYCLSSRSDIPLENKDLELVFKELDMLVESGVQIVKFVDRTFNANPARARKIWKYLADKHKKTRFHFEIYPQALQKADFELLACVDKDNFQFEIGVQSTNTQTLNEIGRPHKQALIFDNIRSLLALKKFHTHTDLIAGLPYEDIQSFRKSFNELYALGADHLQLGILKVLPGTQMAEKMDEYRIIATKAPPYEVLATKWLSFDDLSILKDIAEIVERLHNSNNFVLSLAEIDYLTPFDFFKALIPYYTTPKPKDFRSNVQILLKFAHRKLAHKYPQIFAAMRLDWCGQLAARAYPDELALDTDILLRPVKTMLGKHWKEDTTIPYLLSIAEFKKGMLTANNDSQYPYALYYSRGRARKKMLVAKKYCNK